MHSGVWTILFTDIVGSTEQRSRLGDTVGDRLRREHDAIVERAVTRHAGFVVKGTGDGAMCAFGSAVAALDAAVLMSHSIDTFNAESSEPLSIRIGVSLGELVFENDDLHGLPANEAARLCAASAPGEILVADIVRNVVASRSTATFEDRGQIALKGLEGARQVWSLEVARSTKVVVPELPATLARVGSLPFTGRAADLECLRAIWDDVKRGERQLAFVSGEPGIGKTRLASELAHIAHHDGALVLYGRCDPDFATPFQPFVEAVDWYSAHAPEEHFTLGAFPADIARFAPVASTRTEPDAGVVAADPEVERYRLFEAVTGWLRAVARDLPVLLVLDDLHWATGPTLAMLQHALRDADLGPVFVLATYRDTDVDRRHPLVDVRANLERLTVIQHVQLYGLDEDQVCSLLAATAGQPIDDQMFALGRALTDQTDGNPFFVGQVLRHLTEQGRLVQREDRWFLEGSADDLGLPRGVQALVQHRIGRLADSAIEALRTAAAIGREFDLDLLARLLDCSEDNVLDAVDAAVATRLVDELSPDRYRFVHALVRTALLDEISAARLARLHRRVAEALERRGDEEPSTIAYHWVQAGTAGDQERRVAALIAAGERAMARLAFVEAAEYFQRALEDHRESVDAHPAAICELLVLAGEAHAASGDYEHARHCYVECGDLAAANGLDEWIVGAGLRLSGPNAYRSTVTDEERALVALAYAHCPESDLAARSILAARHAALLDDRFEERQRWTDLARDLAERSGSDEARRFALSQLVLTGFHPGELDRQLATTDEIVALARRSGSIEAVLEALMLRCLPLGVAGRWTDFDDARIEVEREAERYGHAYYQAAAMIAHAARLSCMGELEEAERLSNAAIGIYGGDEIAMPWIAQLIQIRDFQGRLDELKASVSRRMAEEETLPALLLLLAVGMLMALTDDAEAGRAVLREAAANDLAALSPPGWRAHSFELAMFAYVAALVHEESIAIRIHDALLPYDGQQVVGSIGIFLGPVALYLGMLERLQGLDQDALRHFDAAIDHCDRHGDVSYGGMVRAELVYLLETSDCVADLQRARDLRAEILDLAERRGLVGPSLRLDVLARNRAGGGRVETADG
jgi:predicted ATPase/class 3 adenylate cyclase